MHRFYHRFGLLLTFLTGYIGNVALALPVRPAALPAAAVRGLPDSRNREAHRRMLTLESTGEGVALLVPDNQQVMSEWVALRWILDASKANERYQLFVKDLTANRTVVDYLDIPPAESAYGLGGLLPDHQYEWGIRAVNLFDPNLSSTRTARFSRVENPNYRILLRGGAAEASFCKESTISLPYTISGYTSASLSGFISATGEANGFISAMPFTQTPEVINGQLSVTGANLRVRGCIVQGSMLGCSNASTAFQVKDPGTVSVHNSSGSTTTLACTGSAVTLYARVEGSTGGEAPRYHWLKDGCTIIEGANDSTLTVQEEGRYQAVVTTSGCQSTSPEHPVKYSLTITPALETNQISGFRCSWEDAYVKTDVAGDNNSYVWYRNDVQLEAPSRPLLAITEPGVYKVRVRSANCEATSDPLRVTAGSSLALTIQTADSAICASGPDDKYLYAHIPQGDRSRMRYQWVKDGQVVAGANQDYIYTRTPGSYTLKVLIDNCEIVSNTLVLKYGALERPVILNGQLPMKGVLRLCTAETVTLKADVPAGMSVVWKKDGIADTSVDKFRVISQPGVYVAVGYSPAGACYSESAPVEVVMGNEMEVNLEGDSLLCGTNQAFLRYIGNTNSRDFQWYKDGTLLEGSSSRTLHISEPGTYALKVKTYYAGGCEGRSKPVKVSDTYSTFPRTITVLGGTERCPSAGVPLRFSPAMIGRVQWKRDGVDIPDATTSYYHALSSGQYTVEVTNGSCLFTSQPIPVRINEPVVALLSGGATLPYPGSSTSLWVQLSGPGPYTLTFSDGTLVPNVEGSTYEHKVAPAFTTTYKLSSVSSACGTGTTSGVAIVNVENGDVYSIRSGLWEEPSTWSCNCVPTALQNVEVRQGHSVSVNAIRAQAKNIRLRGGQLLYPSRGELKIGQD